MFYKMFYKMLNKILGRWFVLDYDIVDTYIEKGKNGHFYTKHIKKWKLKRKNKEK